MTEDATRMTEDAARGRRRAPGSGSRARSREIGYAQAMCEIGQLLRAEAARWRNSADQQINAHAHAALTVVAGNLGEIADFAFGAFQLHINERGSFARDVEHLAFLEREYNARPARCELPAD